MASHFYMFSVVFLALIAHVAYAADPNQLQDFCVGVNRSVDGVFVNGLFCKDPQMVTSEDFTFRGILTPRPVDNIIGSVVTTVNAFVFPGLNTLSISFSRIDFAPRGLNPPHIHPRATEVQTCLEGTLYVGFTTSNQRGGGNRFFTTILKAGDVFVFPQGMIHFEFNIGHTPAMSLVSFSSQNPGTITIANATFGSTPPIRTDVLSQTFQLDPEIIMYLQRTFMNNTRSI